MVAEDWGGIGREIRNKYYGVSKDTFKIQAINGKPLGTGLSQARTPLSEYSLDEIRQFLSSLNLSMMETDILDDMVKKVSTVARKCYKPCCAAKPEPIDWSTSWNPDYDDHG